MQTSSVRQKIGASAINCGLVILISAPLGLLLGYELWRPSTILIFFAYNMMFRARCIGMRVVKTYIEPPTSPYYALCYTVGFSTFFYSVIFPFDLLLLNGIAQIGSVMMTGNTLHGNLAGQGTMSKEQYIERAKQRARDLVAEGKLREAVASICMDLGRYPELKPPAQIVLAGLFVVRDGEQAVRDYIEGFQ